MFLKKEDIKKVKDNDGNNIFVNLKNDKLIKGEKDIDRLQDKLADSIYKNSKANFNIQKKYIYRIKGSKRIKEDVKEYKKKHTNIDFKKEFELREKREKVQEDINILFYNLGKFYIDKYEQDKLGDNKITELFNNEFSTNKNLIKIKNLGRIELLYKVYSRQDDKGKATEELFKNRLRTENAFKFIIKLFSDVVNHHKFNEYWEIAQEILDKYEKEFRILLAKKGYKQLLKYDLKVKGELVKKNLLEDKNKPSIGMKKGRAETLDKLKGVSSNKIIEYINKVCEYDCFDLKQLCNKVKKHVENNKEYKQQKELYFILDLIKEHYHGNVGRMNDKLNFNNKDVNQVEKLLLRYIYDYIKGRYRKVIKIRREAKGIKGSQIQEIFEYQSVKNKLNYYIVSKVNYYFENKGKRNIHTQDEKNNELTSLDLEYIKAMETLLLKLNTAIAQANYNIGVLIGKNDKDFLGGSDAVHKTKDTFFKTPSFNKKYSYYFDDYKVVDKQSFINELVNGIYQLRLLSHHYDKKLDIKSLQNNSSFCKLSDFYEYYVSKSRIIDSLVEKLSSTVILKYYNDAFLVEIIKDISYSRKDNNTCFPSFKKVYKKYMKLLEKEANDKEKLETEEKKLARKNLLRLIYNNIYRYKAKDLRKEFIKLKENKIIEEQEKNKNNKNKKTNNNNYKYFKLPIYKVEDKDKELDYLYDYYSQIQKQNSESQQELKIAINQYNELISMNFMSFVNNISFKERSIEEIENFDSKNEEKILKDKLKELEEIDNLEPPKFKYYYEYAFFGLAIMIDNTELSHLQNNMMKFQQFIDHIQTMKEISKIKLGHKERLIKNHRHVFDNLINVFSIIIDMKDKFYKNEYKINTQEYIKEINKGRTNKKNNIKKEINNKTKNIKLEEIKLIDNKLIIVNKSRNAKFTSEYFFECNYNNIELKLRKTDKKNKEFTDLFKEYWKEMNAYDSNNLKTVLNKKFDLICNSLMKKDLFNNIFGDKNIINKHYEDDKNNKIYYYRDGVYYITYNNLEKANKYGMLKTIVNFLDENNYKVKLNDFKIIEEIDNQKEREKRDELVEKWKKECEKNDNYKITTQDLQHYKKINDKMLAYDYSHNKVYLTYLYQINSFITDIYSRLVSWTAVWERDIKYYIKANFDVTRKDDNLNVHKLLENLYIESQEKGYTKDEVQNILINAGYLSEENVYESKVNERNKNVAIRNSIAHYHYFTGSKKFTYSNGKYLEDNISLKQLVQQVYSLFRYSKKRRKDVTDVITNIFKKHGMEITIKNYDFEDIRIKSEQQYIVKKFNKNIKNDFDSKRISENRCKLIKSLFEWQPNRE